jgi:drug/metabolite transporter (DMT)-like permease
LRSHPLFTAYLAFASVCFFWGTTYLGIRIALESFPPLFLVSVRFLISGTLLAIGLRFAGIPLPKGRTLAWTALFGVMVLGVGNTCLTYSETLIPSSLAALFISVSPIWTVCMEALMPNGERLRPGTVAGMGLGLVGAGLLVGPDMFQQGFSGQSVQGFLLLQFGGISWGLGSILQRRVKAQAHPVASAAVHQFAAGLFFLTPTLLDTSPVHWDAKGIHVVHHRAGPAAAVNRDIAHLHQSGGGGGAGMAVLSRAVRAARDRCDGGDLCGRGDREALRPPVMGV